MGDETIFDAEKYYWQTFNEVKSLVNSLNSKQKDELEEFLGDMEQEIQGTDKRLKDFEDYIKRHTRKKKILFITFKTRNINKLAHICRYILDLEWNNEWAMAVAGQHTPTMFGWFD